MCYAVFTIPFGGSGRYCNLSRQYIVLCIHLQAVYFISQNSKAVCKSPVVALDLVSFLVFRKIFDQADTLGVSRVGHAFNAVPAAVSAQGVCRIVQYAVASRAFVIFRKQGDVAWHIVFHPQYKFSLRVVTSRRRLL